MVLPVVSAKTVQLDDGGAVRTVRLAAPTVGSLLEAAGAPLQQRAVVASHVCAPDDGGGQQRCPEEEDNTVIRGDQL